MQPRILLLNGPDTPYYRDAVTQCGGIAIEGKLPEVSTDYDGLILCGGADIDPAYYGEALAGSVGILPERDKNDFAFTKAFVEAGKPILGICRGHQILNVYFGGSLCQHIPTTDLHRIPGDAVHWVAAEEESFLSRVYGQRFRVNSHHHQGVNRLGKDLRITLRCEADGTVEALAHDSLPIFSVQWHPERMCLSREREDTVNGLAVFRHFLQLVKDYRNS